MRNRTNDWSRVRHGGELTVIDEPGRITVTAAPPLLSPPRLIVGGGALALAVVMLILGVADGGALMLSGCAAVIALANLWGIAPLYWKLAFKVVFEPDAIHFYNLFGVRRGSLERAAMQQIAVEPLTYLQFKDGRVKTLQCHVFYADTGYCSALPQKIERMATLRNNVLLAAFNQPLHLDGAEPMRQAA